MDDLSFFEDDLDEKKAKRSILVTDLPEKVSPKDVVIHFQKQSNDGGEVVNIDDHGDKHRSFVVITFEHPEIVERAIGRPHIIDGTKVTVQRYPVRIPEMFLFVDAAINLDVFSGSVSLLEEVLQPLQREIGFQCSTNHYGSYMIHGTYKQITLCHKYILDEIRNGKTTRLMTPGSASDDMALENASPEERGATGTMSDDEKIKTMVYQAVPIILEFILTVQKYAKKIQKIESKFNVEIKGIEGGSKVAIIPLPRCMQTEYNDACEDYIELYKEVYVGPMASENKALIPGSSSSYSAEDAVKQVLQDEPVAIQQMEEQDKWMFYGEETNVKSAIDAVCKLLKIDNPLRKSQKTNARVRHFSKLKENDIGAANSHFMPARNDEAGEYPPLGNPNTRSVIHKDFPGDKGQPFVIETKKGFRLTVSKGDITQGQVDVIVNSADRSLSFTFGLPRAIVERGGEGIRDEAKKYRMTKSPKPGDVVITTSGNLDCSRIMHILTKKCGKKKEYELECQKLVKEACLKCLNMAQSRKLKSIAFPAVGSGQQEMPLHVCAAAMISAVEDYMKRNGPEKGAVTDIRFVHLDPAAVEAFKVELSKRYKDSIVTTPGRADITKRTSHSTLTLTSGRRSVSSSDKKTEQDKEHEKDVCPICLDGFHDPVSLSKCNHQFCRQCIEKAFQQHRRACPTCGMTYGVQTGNMPRGTMNYYLESHLRLPGYELYGAIRIDYHFPNGTQGPEHPNPGQYYTGTSRTAFLPDCPEGREVLDLLKKAFNARLTFTIGKSVTTGASNVVTWNDIHHKTDPYGGATGFGYPDPTYLKRVKAELAAKGIN